MVKLGGNLTVMVVEDEALLNDAYTQVLSSTGIKVIRAFNGQEAIDKLKKQTPDIILLDLRMPVVDGISFLKQLRPKQTLPSTKIVVFSNYDDQQEIDEAFKLGAAHYMLKAWATPDELIKLIDEISSVPQSV